MKKLAIALTLALLLSLSGCLDAGEQAFSPHEDPSLASETLDGFSLLRFYTDALGLIAASSYGDAQSLLAELREAGLPDELRYVSDRYNDLCQQLSGLLDRLETLLAEASGLLDQNRLDDAGQRLSQAASLGVEAGLALDEIKAATVALRENLGALGGLAGGSLETALERLEDVFGRLEGLLDRLAALQAELTRSLEQAGVQLEATTLELELAPDSAYVGEAITLSGRLAADSGGLPGREVALYLGGQRHGVTTSAEGLFSASLDIPYSYEPVLTAQAFYIPSGADDAVYAAASASLSLEVLFYGASLAVEPPAALRPGLPITLNGHFSSEGEEIAHRLEVRLDSRLLAETVISGDFSVEITPPPDTTEGSHSLELRVDSSGRHRGASLSLDVTVSRLPLQADVELPSLIVLPESMQVGGAAYYADGFPDGANVSISFRGATAAAATSDFGRFNTSLRVPFEPFLFGPYELELTITPAEPWLEPYEVSRRIIIINPLHLGLIAAVFLSAGLLGYRKRRPPLAATSGTAAHSGGSSPPPVPDAPVRPYETIGAAGRVLSAYLEAQSAVQSRSGLAIRRQQTLGEYLAEVPLPTSLKLPFAILTEMAEAAMYSGRQPIEGAALEAARLAAGIVKEVDAGAPV